MAALDNVWAMYMGLKDRRRQKERDDVADDNEILPHSLGEMESINVRASESQDGSSWS